MKLKDSIKILIAIILIGIGCTFLYYMIISPNYIIEEYNYNYNLSYNSRMLGLDINPENITFGLIGIGNKLTRHIEIETKNITLYFHDYYFKGTGSELLIVKCPEIIEPFQIKECNITLNTRIENNLKPGFYEGKLYLKYKDKP